VRHPFSSSVGETGDVGDMEESREADVTELLDLSTCQWLPLPSVSSDPSEISAIIPLSETRTPLVYNTLGHEDSHELQSKLN
jgi:hypothetical protein